MVRGISFLILAIAYLVALRHFEPAIMGSLGDSKVARYFFVYIIAFLPPLTLVVCAMHYLKERWEKR